MTTKAKEKPRTLESVEAEIAATRGRLAELEDEQRGTESAPVQGTWDPAHEGAVADRLAEADSRRAVLPALIHAGRVREAELEVERLGLEIPRAHAEVEPLYERKMAAEEAEREATRERVEAGYDWSDAIKHAQALEMQKRNAERNLAGLKARTPVVDAPVVRSVWQQNFREVRE